MFKIESKEFFPIPGDKDFKVVIKAPSFSEFQEATLEANTGVSVGGPATSASPSYAKFVEKIISTCVVKVCGLMVMDEIVDTGDKLVKKAPPYLVANVLEEILAMAKPSENEIKN